MSARRTKVILATSIPGMAMNEVVASLERKAAEEGKTISCLDVESQLRRIVKERHGDEFTSLKYSKILAYSLPARVISRYASEALDSAFNEVKQISEEGADYVFVTCHPVFFHQVTRSFLQPYQASDIVRFAENANVDLWTVATVHDDVYDVYRRLLGLTGFSYRRTGPGGSSYRLGAIAHRACVA